MYGVRCMVCSSAHPLFASPTQILSQLDVATDLGDLLNDPIDGNGISDGRQRNGADDGELRNGTVGRLTEEDEEALSPL